MYLYVIYFNPSDYPGKYVVRRWLQNTPDPEPMAVVDDIGSARDAVPLGLIRWARFDRSYQILPDGAIHCLLCGFTSHNQHDVEKRYCGQCHQFHSEGDDPAILEVWL